MVAKLAIPAGTTGGVGSDGALRSHAANHAADTSSARTRRSRTGKLMNIGGTLADGGRAAQRHIS